VRDVKLILPILCALLLGSPAIAADVELQCRGDLIEGPRPATITKVKFAVSLSGREVALQIDPKYGLEALPLFIIKSNPLFVVFESVERSKNPSRESKPMIMGGFFRAAGKIFIDWEVGETRSVAADCEILVGSRSTISPEVT
jgi:hypothetical protein